METNQVMLSHVCDGLPNRDSFTRIESIRKGVSGDKKYRLDTEDGRRVLLRVSDIESYERKQTMFDMMRRVAARGVSMSRPIDFGVCNDGKNVYQLLSWCDGETADVVLPTVSETQQYAIGIKAGHNLRLIHSIHAPDGLEDWYDRFVGTSDGRIKAFSKCGVLIDGSDRILSYYEENRHLLRGRPQCLIHGDYHNQNLLVSESHDIAIVDWELLDHLYGDPWSEFNRILHTNLVPHFTTGMLHGYFGGEPPEEFWRILALYLSTGALMLLSWSVYVEPRFLEESKQTALNVMQWFDGMRSPIPTWYGKHLAYSVCKTL